MALTSETGLNIPSQRLIGRTMAILNDRDKYFMDLIRKFREKYPNLKIIYANNLVGARLNPEHPTADFVIVAKGLIKSKDPRLPDRSMLYMDAPMIFTDRSLAGWTIAVESGNMDGYFRYMMDKALRIPSYQFANFLQTQALLSLDKNSPLFWKKPENTEKFTKELEWLYARYNKKVSNRMEEKRGYDVNANPK